MDRDDQLLVKIGMCLMQLQRIEFVVGACLAGMPKLEGNVSLSLEDILSPDDAKRKYTLGQLLKPLRSGIPLGELDNRLAEFVKNRNAFIHNYWLEVTNSWPLDEAPYVSANAYVSSLSLEALDIERVFRGLFAFIAACAFEQHGVDLHASHPHLRKFLEGKDYFFRATGDDA